jgi:hypothetical protein
MIGSTDACLAAGEPRAVPPSSAKAELIRKSRRFTVDILDVYGALAAPRIWARRKDSSRGGTARRLSEESAPMKHGASIMVVHLVRMGAMTVLIIACMFLPYFPGGYDGLAVTLSGMSQLFGVAGLLLVPIGALWLIYELRKRAPKNRERSNKDKGYYFAIASLVASSMLAAIVSLVSFINLGLSLWLGVLALWAYCVSRMARRVKRLKNAEIGNFNPAPLYLLVVPTMVALFQFSLVGPATKFSRQYAIRKSAELITDIEEYHQAHGRYPTSLLSLWKDYKPSIMGIEQFHYEPHGDAYNIYFEQLSSRFGTREIVMYNKLDEHFMATHDADILSWTPEELHTRRGYYAVHDASSPHWKYFWFD